MKDGRKSHGVYNQTGGIVTGLTLDPLRLKGEESTTKKEREKHYKHTVGGQRSMKSLTQKVLQLHELWTWKVSRSLTGLISSQDLRFMKVNNEENLSKKAGLKERQSRNARSRHGYKSDENGNDRDSGGRKAKKRNRGHTTDYVRKK